MNELGASAAGSATEVVQLDHGRLQAPCHRVQGAAAPFIIQHKQ